MVADGLASDAAITDVTSVLRGWIKEFFKMFFYNFDYLGEAFCKSKDLGLNPDQIEACVNYIIGFMPISLKNMSEIVQLATPKLCQDVFKVC